VDALRLLREGELEVRGRLIVSSNAALLCTVALAPVASAAIYKPIRFERPLWDFPDGTLAHREVAAFLVSEATGWEIVPPTVLRDGPAGPGMVQLWIDEDEAVDAWELVQTADERLRPMAVFDAVVNNTDRKGGHILPVRRAAAVAGEAMSGDGAAAVGAGEAGDGAAAVGAGEAGDGAAAVGAGEAGDGDGALHLYGVDHGVCFSDEPKLRTVLWAWRGTPLASPELDVLRRLRADLDGDLGRGLRQLLAPEEIRATRDRIEALLADGRFPQPLPDRPAIPWPPF
jgi:hypothetical protein